MTGATGVHLLLWDDDRARLAAARHPPAAPPRSAAPATRHAAADCRCCATSSAPVNRWSWPTPPVTTGSPATRTSPTWTAARCWPSPSSAAGSLRAVLLLENRLLRGAFTADRLDAVTLIAGQLAVSLDNAQLYAELTASRARIVAAADHARRRIERDLHDGAQQRLVSLALRLRAAQAALPPESGELAAQLDSLVERGDQHAGRAARTCPRHPPGAARRGRAGSGAGRTRPPQRRPRRADVAVEGRLPEQVEIAAYYAVSEALTNTAKHAASLVVHDRGRHRPGRRHRHAAGAGPRRRPRRRRPRPAAPA